MGLNPWPRGATAPAWQMQLKNDTGLIPLTNLATSGPQLQLVIVDGENPNLVVYGAGGFTILSVPLSKVSYAPALADVNLAPKAYWIRVRVYYNDGTHTDTGRAPYVIEMT